MYVWEEGKFVLLEVSFFFLLSSLPAFLSPMHSYGKRREERRPGRFRMVRDEAQSFFIWAKLFILPHRLKGEV